MLDRLEATARDAKLRRDLIAVAPSRVLALIEAARAAEGVLTYYFGDRATPPEPGPLTALRVALSALREENE